MTREQACEFMYGTFWPADMKSGEGKTDYLMRVLAERDALANELAAVQAIHNDAVFITDEHYDQCPKEVQKIIGKLAVMLLPTTDAFLREQMAKGVDAFARSLRGEAEITKACTFKPVQQFEEFAARADEVAAQLRAGEAV